MDDDDFYEGAPFATEIAEALEATLSGDLYAMILWRRICPHDSECVEEVLRRHGRA